MRKENIDSFLLSRKIIYLGGPLEAGAGAAGMAGSPEQRRHRGRAALSEAAAAAAAAGVEEQG